MESAKECSASTHKVHNLVNETKKKNPQNKRHMFSTSEPFSEAT